MAMTIREQRDAEARDAVVRASLRQNPSLNDYALNRILAELPNTAAYRAMVAGAEQLHPHELMHELARGPVGLLLAPPEEDAGPADDAQAELERIMAMPPADRLTASRAAAKKTGLS